MTTALDTYTTDDLIERTETVPTITTAYLATIDLPAGSMTTVEIGHGDPFDRIAHRLFGVLVVLAQRAGLRNYQSDLYWDAMRLGELCTADRTTLDLWYSADAWGTYLTNEPGLETHRDHAWHIVVTMNNNERTVAWIENVR